MRCTTALNMDSSKYLSSLWDSRHDWILQYDNILKGNITNQSYRKGSFSLTINKFTAHFYNDISDQHPIFFVKGNNRGDDETDRQSVSNLSGY